MTRRHILIALMAVLGFAAHAPAAPTVVAKVAPSGQGMLFLFTDSLARPEFVSDLAADPAQWPKIRVGGGAPVALANPYWGVGLTNSGGSAHPKKPYLPWVYFAFIQDAPDVRYEPIGAHLNTFSGSWSRTLYDLPNPAQGVTGYAGFLTRVSASATATATFPQSPLPAGTYRVSATWPAGATFSSDVTYTVADRSGAALGTLHADHRAAPSGPVDAGVPWALVGTFTVPSPSGNLVVTQRNASTGPMIADAVKFERVSAPVAVTIPASAQVTYTAPAGWATSASGAAPAATDAAAQNLVGDSFFPTLDPAPTMGVGYNLPSTNYYTGFVQYSNYARCCALLPALERDADGYPTKIAGSSVGQIVTQNQPTTQADGLSLPIVPPGRYQLLWDGASSVTFNGAEDASKRVITGGAGNRRVYTLTGTTRSYGPDLSVTISAAGPANADGTRNVDFRNWKILPEAADPATAGKWSAELARDTARAPGRRFLDPFGGNGTNVEFFSDLQRADSYVVRSNPYRSLTAKITQVRAYTGPNIWDPHERPIFEYTTAAPHGFRSSYTTKRILGSVGSATLSNGSTYSLDGKTGLIYVTSPTTFILQDGLANTQVAPTATPVTMTNVLTPASATVTVDLGNGMTLADMVDQCNAFGSDLYLTMPISTPDPVKGQVGTYVGRNLAAGLKFRCEEGNEPWNSGFSQWSWYKRESFRKGLSTQYDFVPGYLMAAKATWAAVGAAMAAEGRAGDFIRVLGSQHANPGITQAYAAFCQANGIAPDELAVGPYWSNGPSATVGYGGSTPGEPGFRDLCDVLTAGQLLDFYEAFYQWGGRRLEVPNHRAALDAKGFTSVKIIAYEGGFEGMLPNGSVARQGERSHAAHRHPRAHRVAQGIFQIYQDTGISLFHDYLLSGGDGIQTGVFVMWPVFTFTGMPPGTGDPRVDVANVLTPDRLDLVKSEVGGGIAAWNSRYAGVTPPPTPEDVRRAISRIRAILKLRRRSDAAGHPVPVDARPRLRIAA